MRKKLCGLGTLLLLALAYTLDTECVFPYFVTATIVHELGHVVAVYACGGRVRGFAPEPFGFCIRFDGMLSYWRDAVIAGGGAAMNLMSAFFLSVASKYLPDAEALTLAAGVNLLLGLFNLLPALPLDGGRMLYALLAQLTDDRRALIVARGASLVVGAAAGMLGVYILVKTRYNMSILAVSGLILGGTYAQGAGKNITARA